MSIENLFVRRPVKIYFTNLLLRHVRAYFHENTMNFFIPPPATWENEIVAFTFFPPRMLDVHFRLENNIN